MGCRTLLKFGMIGLLTLTSSCSKGDGVVYEVEHYECGVLPFLKSVDCSKGSGPPLIPDCRLVGAGISIYEPPDC